MQWHLTLTGKIFRRAVALTLVLWLAGVGCFLGCEFSVSAAGNAVETAAAGQAESCDAFAGHDCCRNSLPTPAAQSNQADVVFDALPPASSGRLMCCPLAQPATDPPRRLNLNDMPLALVAPSSPSPALSVQYLLPEVPQTLRVPDRGSSYLRCCAFLI